MKSFWRQLRTQRRYEHNTEPISSELLEDVKKLLKECSTPDWAPDEPAACTLAIALDRHGQATDVLAQLAKIFLDRDLTVQYLTASRHPIEFVNYLSNLIGPDSWANKARRMVIVDAFTPHFGFTDSIHDVKTNDVKRMGVTCIQSSVSYAGMHTASSKAFNEIKKGTDSEVRRPALVIYEDTHTLADLESREQYRIFVRHVIPSERMWGGMLTVFTEVVPPEDDWMMLSAYAGMSLDMRAFHHPTTTPSEVAG